MGCQGLPSVAKQNPNLTMSVQGQSNISNVSPRSAKLVHSKSSPKLARLIKGQQCQPNVSI